MFILAFNNFYAALRTLLSGKESGGIKQEVKTNDEQGVHATTAVRVNDDVYCTKLGREWAGCRTNCDCG